MKHPRQQTIIILFVMALAAFVFLNTRHFDIKTSETPKKELVKPNDLPREKNIHSGKLLQDGIQLIRRIFDASLDFEPMRTGAIPQEENQPVNI